MKKQFILDLARLMAALAWADGKVTNTETNCLKDFLFGMKGITEEDWKELQAYLDYPVQGKEAQELADRLLDRISSEEEKKITRSVLEELMDCDGTATREENDLLEQVNQALDNKQITLRERLAGLVGLKLKRRQEALQKTPSREERMDDFIKNTIYFRLVTRLTQEGKNIDIDEQNIRRLCLAAGLMGRVAWADRKMDSTEKKKLSSILKTAYGLDQVTATLLMEISTDESIRKLDLYRLARTYYEESGKEERKNMLKTLFAIANADGQTSLEEIEEIRAISKLLHLDHEDFIKAKQTVPAADREGF